MRVLTLLLMFSLGLGVLYAQQETGANKQGQKKTNEQLNHKIHMVNYILHSPAMLQRLESSDDNLAKDLVARAAENFLEMEEYFERGQFLEAEAIIDYVLRDLSASSQLLNVSNKKRNKYKTLLEQLDSFILPAWKNLSAEENEFLQNSLQQIDKLRDQAISQAQSEAYDQAVKSAEEAYNLKVALINKLQHESTVIYDLKFATEHEEYDYLNNRTYHYLELVDVAIAKKEPDLQARKLVDNYIYQSMINLEAAENFESRGNLNEAIPVLNKSIQQLTSVLKILGINY